MKGKPRVPGQSPHQMPPWAHRKSRGAEWTIHIDVSYCVEMPQQHSASKRALFVTHFFFPRHKSRLFVFCALFYSGPEPCQESGLHHDSLPALSLVSALIPGLFSQETWTTTPLLLIASYQPHTRRRAFPRQLTLLGLGHKMSALSDYVDFSQQSFVREYSLVPSFPQTYTL